MAIHRPASDEPVRRLDQVERELSNLRETVESTDRLATLGSLTAGIAHELNNILAPALGYAQLAQRSPENVELVEKALERTIESVSAAAEILASALDLAGGRQTESTVAADPADAVNGALKCLARDPERDQVTIRQEVTPDLKLAIGPRALQQVILNLVTNAIGALRSVGGGTVTIRVAPSEAEGTADLRVMDDGPGVPDSIASQIFDDFVTTRAVDRSDPQAGGHGLGLAICRRTVTRYGGSIELEPSDGGGATFHVELPLATAAAEAAQSNAEANATDRRATDGDRGREAPSLRSDSEERPEARPSARTDASSRGKAA